MLTREELEEKVAKAVVDHFPLVLFPSLWSMWMRCDNCVGSHVDKLPVASSPLWKRNDHIFHTCMRKHNQNITHLLCIQDGLIYHRMIDVFQLQRCYLKDASLEMPHAPEILLQAQQEQPQVDIKFEVSQKTVAEALYDVTVRGTITVKAADKVIILVEGTQSGLFAIHGIPVEALQHVTNVVCPAMVYPYLRANLADLMNRANVPPVHLPEVNFEVLYQQRLAQAQAEAEGAAQA